MRTIFLMAGILSAALPRIAHGGTVAYWRFEEGTGTVVHDSSGNHFDGTIQNGASFSTNVPVSTIPLTGAKNNYSLDFNGINQSVEIPDNPKFYLTTGLTLEAYINITSNASGHEAQIVFRGDDRPALDPYFLSLEGNQIAFSMDSPNGVRSSARVNIPAFGKWLFVAGTFDASTDLMKLYINGVLVDTTEKIGPVIGALDPNFLPGLGIGNVQSNTYSEYFNGLIDEVRISDQALTPNQFLDFGGVPEPSSLSLLGVGLLALLAARRVADGEGKWFRS